MKKIYAVLSVLFFSYIGWGQTSAYYYLRNEKVSIEIVKEIFLCIFQ